MPVAIAPAERAKFIVSPGILLVSTPSMVEFLAYPFRHFLARVTGGASRLGFSLVRSFPGKQLTWAQQGGTGQRGQAESAQELAPRGRHEYTLDTSRSTASACWSVSMAVFKLRGVMSMHPRVICMLLSICVKRGRLRWILPDARGRGLFGPGV